MKILKALSHLKGISKRLDTLAVTTISDRDQYIEVIDGLRKELEDAQAEILALAKMDPVEADRVITNVITALKEHHKYNTAFNIAMTQYTYTWLKELPDHYFAYNLCIELNKLFEDKKNPDWIRFIRENSL